MKDKSVELLVMFVRLPAVLVRKVGQQGACQQVVVTATGCGAYNHNLKECFATLRVVELLTARNNSDYGIYVLFRILKTKK